MGQHQQEILTQGETMQELLLNIYDAVKGCLSVDLKTLTIGARDSVMDIAV